MHGRERHDCMCRRRLGDLVRSFDRMGTLSVVMFLATVTSAAVGAAETNVSAPDGSGSAKQKYRAPRTESGQPELRGVWNFSSDTPLERPEKYRDRPYLTREEWDAQHRQREARAQTNEREGRGLNNSPVGGYNEFWTESLAQHPNLRTSLIIDPPDGRMPSLQTGIKVEMGGLGPDTPGERPVRFRVGGISKDGPEDRGLSERCLMGFNSGPPFMPSSYNNNVQIFQTGATVVIMTEMIHDARIVKLDQRPALDPAIVQWSGESRGHWEGDTLVVETSHFTDKVQSFRGAGTGKTLHLIERFTRVGKDELDYQFTVDDPATYTKPITVLVPMVRADGEIFEYACHEGNYGLGNLLSGERQAERERAAKQ